LKKSKTQNWNTQKGRRQKMEEEEDEKNKKRYNLIKRTGRTV
jgi:hypothetical protein